MSSDEDLLENVQLKQTAHRWEHTGKTWDTLFQKDGQLVSIMKDGASWESQYQKKKNELKGKVRGLIRSLVVVIDLTEAGLAPLDFGMPRIRLITEELSSFISGYIDQNPLSQVSIVTTFNYKAQIQTPLCGDIKLHLNTLQHLTDITTAGEPSIYNALTVASNLLSTVPPYSTKEVLMIYGSLNSCDPQPFDSLLNLVTNNNKSPFKCTVSTIGLSSEIDILKKLAEATNGKYNIPLSKDHLTDLLNSHVLPPAWNDMTQRRRFIPFGFTRSVDEKPSFDLKKIYNEKSVPAPTSFCCPQCKTRVNALPTYCPCCSLLLMSPAHLTRSLQHLKPLDQFVQPKTGEKYGENSVFSEIASEIYHVCAACNSKLRNNEMPYICIHCRSTFCKACNGFIHDCLQVCPKCLEAQNLEE
ncbi:General transcription factor IIH subunit 2 [Tritrichomonas foetus]|uniref:General transcription factor IIH subunit 2 n=1 Tax=Tritrichomonas foetus TaxID=1144522 RepID=A0A1J4J7F4_9EUKA|nr:General transcription factor IIH subunit 2 [Tritrichomonas foetus]|eukprot:OHS93140.1 General transcription factor IIH subunit 2 [Tritrichomonas foetus]